ncbi:hypothetical protein VNI00_017948 [Paramarasmius palmivorus]|uniref:Uncharacterized protein n=1 Tax=Paramarasmius palmivorus TaxID=297713 RepID=A0AAW0B2T1_9AGAR
MDHTTVFRADLTFDLATTIFSRAKKNNGRAPNGVVDHPPLDPPDLEPSYVSPFGSPLSSVTPSEASPSPFGSPLSSLTPSSNSPSPRTTPPPPPHDSHSSTATVPSSAVGPNVSSVSQEGSGGTKKRRRGKKRKRNTSNDVLSAHRLASTLAPLSAHSASPIPSTSASPLSSVSPSPIPSLSPSPLPSTQGSPHSNTLALPFASGLPEGNVETQRKHRIRQAKRRKLKEQGSRSLGRKNLQQSNVVVSEFDSQSMHAQTDGYLGQLGRVPDGDGQVYPLQELVGPTSKHKFRLLSIPADATSIPIIDRNNTVIGVLIGAPRGDKSWDEVAKTAAEQLESTRDKLYFEDKRLYHKRGYFAVQPWGYSFGGGQEFPKRIYHILSNQEQLEVLTDQPCFKRLAGHANGAFATWAPRLYQHYRDYDTRLRERHPGCCRNFSNSIWACATYNFGPNTVTVQHIDHLNYIFGWCAITALGNFDHTKGGHIVLWELGLVLEFPPGWTILIPSAYIRHSNTPIADGESRYSFTQYTAGGLFRWVDDGFQLRSNMDRSQRKAAAARDKERLKSGLFMYSNMDELQNMYKK